jgi:hypothetical protein
MHNYKNEFYNIWKSYFQNRNGNRIYAKKFAILYKNIIPFDCDSLCKKFKKQKSENMCYLILKSPKTKNKRCDIIL